MTVLRLLIACWPEVGAFTGKNKSLVFGSYVREMRTIEGASLLNSGLAGVSRRRLHRRSPFRGRSTRFEG
jgi:hypothetical protein